MSHPSKTYPYVASNSKKEGAFKLTVGNYTTNTGTTPVVYPLPPPISPIPSITIPILVSHSDVLKFFFPKSSDTYLYDGSGSIVNLNSANYYPLVISSIMTRHLFFLQNSFLSNYDLAKSMVLTLTRLS